MKTLFTNGFVYVNDKIEKLELVVKDNVIAYIGEKYCDKVDKTIDLNGKLIMPGFINMHAHSPMSIMRGIKDDCELETWLFDYIFKAEEKLDDYYEEIVKPTSNQKGDEIPVSRFEQSGRMPTDTTRFEKRGIANQLPNWISEKCIQCGRCTMMCPHAVIKPIIVAKVNL